MLWGQATLDDKDSLKKVLEGAYAVFAVTNFWEHMDAEREKKQGINVAEVAAVCEPAPFGILSISNN